LGGLSLALNCYFGWQFIARPEMKREVNFSSIALSEPRAPITMAPLSPQGIAAPVQPFDVRCANAQTPSAVLAKSLPPTSEQQMPVGVTADNVPPTWPAAQDASVSLQQLVHWYNEGNKPADGFFINPFGR